MTYTTSALHQALDGLDDYIYINHDIKGEIVQICALQLLVSSKSKPPPHKALHDL